jgi:uncharacterized protein YbjT (DUF2867 family)
MPVSVAVLGGTGFLGRRIVEQLLPDGAAVRVVARRSSWWQASIGMPRGLGLLRHWPAVRSR